MNEKFSLLESDIDQGCETTAKRAKSYFAVLVAMLESVLGQRSIEWKNCNQQKLEKPNSIVEWK